MIEMMTVQRLRTPSMKPPPPNSYAMKTTSINLPTSAVFVPAISHLLGPRCSRLIIKAVVTVGHFHWGLGYC